MIFTLGSPLNRPGSQAVWPVLRDGVPTVGIVYATGRGSFRFGWPGTLTGRNPGIQHEGLDRTSRDDALEDAASWITRHA